MDKVVMWFTDVYDAILEIVDFVVSRTSESLAGILIKALPLLAPIPNAVSVWRISQDAPLSYNRIQACALASAVEGMFFALTEVTLNMFDGYLKDKVSYKYPLIISVSILASFFILVEVIVYNMETNPIACAFPFISMIAAVALGCARWHKRKSEAWRPARKSVNQKTDSRAIQAIESDESRLIQFYRLNQTASQRVAAESLGLNQSKVNRIIKQLKDKKVIHVNGNGVEVI